MFSFLTKSLQNSPPPKRSRAVRDLIAAPPFRLEIQPHSSAEPIPGLHAGEAAAERGLLDLEQAFNKVKPTDFWVSPKFLDERLALDHGRRLAREQPEGQS